MEDKLKEFSTRIMETLESLTLRVEKLEMDLRALKGEDIPSQNEEEQPIDLSLDDMEAEMGEDLPAGEEAERLVRNENPEEEEACPAEAERLGAVEEDFAVGKERPEALEDDLPVGEDKPESKEDMSGQDGFSGLFEEGLSLKTEKEEGRQYKDLNGKSSSKGKIIMDVMAEKTAWYRDMPGAEVKSLRSAIALGDQVMFIKRLFRGDAALYQDTIEKLNSMTGLKTAVEYISQTFPEWDMESDDVYRFMMAVRRKIR